MALNKKENMTKASIIQEAKNEVRKELADKYKQEYKSLVKQLEAARRVVSNIERQMKEYELKMEQELDGI